MNFVDKDGTTKVYIPVHPCYDYKHGMPCFDAAVNMQHVVVWLVQ